MESQRDSTVVKVLPHKSRQPGLISGITCGPQSSPGYRLKIKKLKKKKKNRLDDNSKPKDNEQRELSPSILISDNQTS